MTVRLKKNDRVKVITGKDKGKEGKIIRRIPERDLVVIEGVNMVSRHVRPSQTNPQSGIIKQEAPIYASKVMLVCPQCGKAEREESPRLQEVRRNHRSRRTLIHDTENA